MGRNPNDLEKKSLKKCEFLQVVINLKIFGQGWSVALTALKHSTFSATVLTPRRWKQMPRSTPPFPGGCWGLWKWWEHCGNSSWIQAVLGGCLGNLLGAWSSSAWSCFVPWGDKETENNGVKMSVYTMFHPISLHEVVQLVVSAHLEKDWLIGSSSQVRVNMSNPSFEICCL